VLGYSVLPGGKNEPLSLPVLPIYNSLSYIDLRLCLLLASSAYSYSEEEAVHSSEMSVNFQRTKWCPIPEDNTLLMHLEIVDFRKHPRKEVLGRRMPSSGVWCRVDLV
jgi:hypothetical protein